MGKIEQVERRGYENMKEEGERVEKREGKGWREEEEREEYNIYIHIYKRKCIEGRAVD